MNNGFNNIHVNPNFIPKCQPKIYVNPTFVCTKQSDNLNHQDLYFPIYENGTENIDHFASCSSYLHDTKINENYVPDTRPTENSSQQCQNYSNQYSNFFLEKSSQSSNDTMVQYKSKKYVSTNYIESSNVDRIVAAERNATYAVSKVSSNQQISKIHKPVTKPVIMGQRMIKNQQVYPSRTNYSLDYRMPYNMHLQEKPVSSFVKANHLFNKPNNLMQKDIKEKAASTIHKIQVLQNSLSTHPNISNKSFVANSISSNQSNVKDQFSKLNIFKTLKSDAAPKTTSNHSPTFESRSTIFKSSMKLIRSDTLRKSAKYIREDILVKKRKYAVKTKTKLIRRNSLGSKYPKFTSVSRLSKLRRSLRLKKGTLIKAREKIVSNYSRPVTVPLNQKHTLFKSKYKFLKNEIVSRYKLNRNPQSKSTPTKNSKLAWSPKLKRNPKKSDKFININGSLYKSTATSLKKQEISSKSKKKTKTSSPKFRSKKFSFKNSKFVYRRQNSAAKLESGTLIEIVRRKKLAQFKRVNDFCFFYNKYGKCKKQNKGCPFIHDPTKIAICTRFLQGSCTENNCPFSHLMDKNKMPVCSHFEEGLCSKENCQYRHVRVNPKAPVCKSFLKGHCPHGEECKKKHILICEDFNKDGNCPRGKKCPLSHRKPKNKPSKKEKTSSTVKKLKQKTKNSKKVGVLGLARSEKTEIKDPKIPSSSNNRYFDCHDDKVTDSQQSVERSDLSTTQDIIPVDIDQKRERLFRKVESMKRSYLIGLEGCEESKHNEAGAQMVTPNCPLSSVTINDNFSCQESTPFKFQHFPLPDVMPSFIPLVIPDD